MLSDVGKTIQATLKTLLASSNQSGPSPTDAAIKEICNALLHANVSPKLILQIRQNLRAKLSEPMTLTVNKEKIVRQAVIDEIIKLFDCETKAYEVFMVNSRMKGSKVNKSRFVERKRPHVILFVGLQGAGKTTTVCKYANYYTKRNYKVGIVCADTFRAGAFDQIKQNALKIKVAFYGSNSEKDPVKVARDGVKKFMYVEKNKTKNNSDDNNNFDSLNKNSNNNNNSTNDETINGNKNNINDNSKIINNRNINMKNDKSFSDFDIILVDSSGRNTQDADLFLEMEALTSAINPTNIILVMDAGIGQSAETHARSFSQHVKIGSIILTKTDGTTKAGGALSSVASVKVPIEFIGCGEGMDQLEKFDAKRFVHKLLGLGDVEGLFEKLETLNIDETEMIKKITKGKFVLKDFHEQFVQLMSLGPMSNLISMIPGMGNINLGNGEDADENMKKMICIFDSLSKNEINSDGSIFEINEEKKLTKDKLNSDGSIKEKKIKKGLRKKRKNIKNIEGITTGESRIIRVARGSGTSPQLVKTFLNQFKMIASMMKKMGKMPGFADMASKDPSKMSLAEKTRMKGQMKGILPKGLFDQMSQFFS